MAFAFDPGLSLDRNLRATAERQLDRAVTALTDPEADPEAAVHDARKRMKKLRGLLRLLRPGLGRTYARENRALRDTARTLSDIRDAQVLVETVARLEALAAEQEAAELLAPLHDWAAGRRDTMLADVDLKERMQAAAVRLQEIRGRTGDWRIDGPEEEALRGGLQIAYKRARKRHAQAAERADLALLHDWRKRVKYHMYHCRLLAPAWPEVVGARESSAKALSADLGDDRDMAQLAGMLEEADLDQPVRRLATGLIESHGAILRERALTRAPRLFVETPSALSRRLTTYWALSA